MGKHFTEVPGRNIPTETQRKLNLEFSVTLWWEHLRLKHYVSRLLPEDQGQAILRIPNDDHLGVRAFRE